MRSSTVSIPTDSRIDFRAGAGREALLVGQLAMGRRRRDAGSGCACRRRWRGATRARPTSTTRTPASKPPRTPNVNTEPGPAGRYRAARSCDGLDGRPAYETQATAGCAARNSATARAFATCRSIRSGSVSIPVRMWNALVGDSAGPEVAQRDRARLHREPEVAERLDEVEAVVGRVGSGQERELAAPLPVEPAGLHDDAAHRRAVAGQELRQRVDDEVGAPLERPAQVRRRERVVDDRAGCAPRGRSRRAPRGRRRRRPGSPATRRRSPWSARRSRAATRRRVRGVDERRRSSRGAGTCGGAGSASRRTAGARRRRGRPARAACRRRAAGPHGPTPRRPPPGRPRAPRPAPRARRRSGS